MFYFKEPISTEQEEEELLKFTLVQRFDSVERNLQQQPRTSANDTQPNKSPHDKLKLHTKPNFEVTLDFLLCSCEI